MSAHEPKVGRRARTTGEALDRLTIAGLAAGLRERVTDRAGPITS